MTGRQTYSIDQIKDMLLARIDQVVHHYAPPAPGSYTLHGQYFTLNPGRADNSVGSFVVYMTGAKASRWCDFAMSGREGRGDILDLIALNLGCSLKDALAEARQFLGLDYLSPEDTRRHREAAERAKRLRADAAAKDREKAEKRRAMAARLWLEGREIPGTPAEAYLRDTRGIRLTDLPRTPHALHFHPNCFYKHIDPETGEVIEGRFPAMLAIACDRAGKIVACHRTYLDLYDGAWRKARVPEQKKVLGNYKGAAIRLWSGMGPRGGKQRLSELKPGAHVYVAEGIEDALSAAVVLPEAVILAAISLSNMAGLWLPETVSDVTLIADRDPGEQAQNALQAAIAAHATAGRRVRVWQNSQGGKDLNDALRARNGNENERGAA